MYFSFNVPLSGPLLFICQISNNKCPDHCYLCVIFDRWCLLYSRSSSLYCVERMENEKTWNTTHDHVFFYSCFLTLVLFSPLAWPSGLCRHVFFSCAMKLSVRHQCFHMMIREEMQKSEVTSCCNAGLNGNPLCLLVHICLPWWKTIIFKTLWTKCVWMHYMTTSFIFPSSGQKAFSTARWNIAGLRKDDHFVAFLVIFLEKHLCQSPPAPPALSNPPTPLPTPFVAKHKGAVMLGLLVAMVIAHCESSPCTPLPHFAKFWSKWVRKWPGSLGLAPSSAELAVEISTLCSSMAPQIFGIGNK